MSRVLTRGDAVERVTRELRAAILDGRLRPGERIGQAAVAEQFGVSRLPVREALRELQNEGLVTVVPNVGARVVRLEAHELDEVYWLRERLEPPLLAESLPHLSDEDLAELRECVSSMRLLEQADDRETWDRVDRRFHLLALSRASLPQVQRTVRSLWNVAIPYRIAFIRAASAWVMTVGGMEHELLLDAIERRDPTDAERLLAMHIRRTRLGLRRHPEVFDDSFPAGYGGSR